MAAIFKYNNKYLATQNLQKKLKKMHLTLEQVEIVYEGDAGMQELDKMIRDLTMEVKQEEVSNHYIYKVYTKEYPQKCILETTNKEEIPQGEYSILIINDKNNFVLYQT